MIMGELGYLDDDPGAPLPGLARVGDLLQALSLGAMGLDPLREALARSDAAEHGEAGRTLGGGRQLEIPGLQINGPGLPI
jgi:hypothetical protein